MRSTNSRRSSGSLTLTVGFELGMGSVCTVHHHDATPQLVPGLTRPAVPDPLHNLSADARNGGDFGVRRAAVDGLEDEFSTSR